MMDNYIYKGILCIAYSITPLKHNPLAVLERFIYFIYFIYYFNVVKYLIY